MFSNLTVDKTQAKHIMLLAAASTSAMVLGVSSIAPLLPTLAKVYNVPLATVSLLITAFTMPGIIFAPLAGFLADRYGRKQVLIPSLIVFSLAGGACAFAPNFHTLILLRFIQGMGCAPLGTLNNTIIGDTFSGNVLARMIGYNMSLLNVCTALYPAISGLLAQIDYRLSFLLPLLSLPVVFIALKTPIAYTPVSIPLGEYCKKMLIPLQTPKIIGLLIITLLSFTLLYGPIITNMPILVSHKFHATPLMIGGMMMLFSIGSGTMASQLGKLSLRFSPRNLLMASQCCYLISLAVIPLMPSIYLIIPFMLLYGCGQGINIPSVQTNLIQSVDKSFRATILALNGMLLRIGQTIAPLTFSALAQWQGVEAPYFFAMLLPIFLLILAYKLIPHAKPVAV